MTPLVTKHFGKEVFTKTQQYDDLATTVTVSSPQNFPSCVKQFLKKFSPGSAALFLSFSGSRSKPCSNHVLSMLDWNFPAYFRRI